MSSPAQAAPSRLQRALGWFDDGRIIKLIFYALLGGAAITIWLDYQGLEQVPDYIPGVTGPAVLPAVERPEIDPAAPNFSPTAPLTVEDDVLTAPLSVSLMPGGVLMLEGTIDPGSAARFVAEVEARGEYVEVVGLNSPGGSVNDALEIATLLRERGFSTEVASGNFCASSCPLVFAAGVERFAGSGAAIGVHQAFAGGANMPGPAQAMSDAQSTTARIVRHLDAMGISAQVWVHALETPPDRLYYFTSDELIDLELATEITD